MALLFSRIAQSKRRASGRRSFVPQLEILEDRTVLSTLTVTNTLDKGAGSLREAITHAKSGDMIVFAPSLNGQTITLTSDQLTINKSLDIEGPGASLLTVSGNDTNRVFDISGGITVTIDGLTITHGLGKGDIQGQNSGGGGGGAILNGGSSVNLATDVFASNRALNHGGAITNGPGSVLNVLNCSFLDNQAVGQVGAAYVEGGAIWNTDNGDTISGSGSPGAGATALVVGSTFIGNEALGADGGSISGGALSETNGGAIHTEGPSDYLSVKDSVFIANQAIAGNGGIGKGANIFTIDVASGGAIANDQAANVEGLHFVVDGCTFSYNQAIGGSNAASDSGRVGHALGGAIASEGVAAISNSAFAHNEALGGDNNTGGSGVLILGRGAGGAVANATVFGSASLTVNNCTFTDNKAAGGSGNKGGLIAGIGVGGGIDNERGSSAAITNCTFTGNQAIGGAGAAGQNGGDGLGGALANYLGSTLTITGCTLTGNQALGGAAGTGANGGNGLGGGIYNDGLSIWPANAGSPATLTVTSSTITDNQANGGTPGGGGGSAGLGEGGGLYLATGGEACLDAFTQAHVSGNHVSTSDDDLFGTFTTCS